MVAVNTWEDFRNSSLSCHSFALKPPALPTSPGAQLRADQDLSTSVISTSLSRSPTRPRWPLLLGSTRSQEEASAWAPFPCCCQSLESSFLHTHRFPHSPVFAPRSSQGDRESCQVFPLLSLRASRTVWLVEVPSPSCCLALHLTVLLRGPAEACPQPCRGSWAPDSTPPLHVLDILPGQASSSLSGKPVAVSGAFPESLGMPASIGSNGNPILLPRPGHPPPGSSLRQGSCLPLGPQRPAVLCRAFSPTVLCKSIQLLFRKTSSFPLRRTVCVMLSLLGLFLQGIHPLCAVRISQCYWNISEGKRELTAL